ncbi:cut9 interacting protein [Grosmannia clavigera kw1407]|uniref:Cut9 interacting protein n=1 Tax=Grosmannia clavigera (strain kw1407 / UAMH 11150) TaxID=655863 RepID=F0XI29_GROCL|nr:cut9 interacting protein [Grosmannia clavigera kw1407]EFX03034.1 cut9 interacting protein [Grosmannia clavigera kw1407]
MCGAGHESAAADWSSAEPFPWASGRVCDAHCHATDTMAAVAAIPMMQTAVLTVMSTRSQDQDLVAALGAADDKVVAAFGWHPWFAYQLYDDGSQADKDKTDGPELTTMDDKRRHLAAVLTPGPSTEAQAAALDALAASLPSVRPLSAFVAETRARLQADPTALVGEIGLDRAFRVPEGEPRDTTPAAQAHTPGGREGRRLSPFRVQPAHQVAVLAAQLRLAAEMRRSVSVHGVQAHGLLFATLATTWRGHERDVLLRRQRRQVAENAEQSSDEEDGLDAPQRPTEKGRPPPTYPPAICLHSFSGPVEMLRQYLDPRIPAAIYFSFSTAVNCGTDDGCRHTLDVVTACPDDRLLVESDLHVAGPPMDAALEDIYRRVCAIKGWPLADGIQRIAQNYDAFLRGRTKHKR